MNRKDIFDKKIDEALSTPPDFSLGERFPEGVLRRIEAAKAAGERKYAYLLVAAIVGFILVSGICLWIFLDGKTLHQILDVSGWGVLIGLLVAIIQVMDQKLIKKSANTY